MSELTNYIKERIEKLKESRRIMKSAIYLDLNVLHIDVAIEELQAVLSKAEELGK